MWDSNYFAKTEARLILRGILSQALNPSVASERIELGILFCAFQSTRPDDETFRHDRIGGEQFAPIPGTGVLAAG